MRPVSHPYATERLTSLRFEAAPCENDEPITRRSGPPIAIEDGAGIVFWQPSLRERLRIFCGAPVRMMLGYSLAPVLLDTESVWGNPVRQDW